MGAVRGGRLRKAAVSDFEQSIVTGGLPGSPTSTTPVSAVSTRAPLLPLQRHCHITALTAISATCITSTDVFTNN